MTAHTQLLSVEEPISLALIATYPEMSEVLAKLVEGTNIQLIDVYAAFEQAALTARELENQVDIILTRGGTGHFIKQAVSVPVISIPITPFDLTLSVAQLSPKVERVGLVNYQRPIFGTEKIESLYQKKIFQYQFYNREDLRHAIQQAKQDGCQVLFGGAEGISYAKELGMEGIEIISGKEAIYQALTEAVDLVRVKREERKRFTRLRIAIGSLSEGICITDEHGKISVFNPAAARIFQLENGDMIGQDINQVPVGELARRAFNRRKEEHNQLEHAGKTILNTNHVPIYMKDKFIGVVSTFQDITKIQHLEGQIRQQLNQKGFKAKYQFEDILTQNPEMTMQKEMASLYAKTDSAVLIQGESGTGKELFAHSIHNASYCASGPFVTVNCAAIPEQLLESELFGYAPGAFTGARREGKQGLFEMAHNGTLFLDEIGEMPKYLQARFLRVLQEKEIMRLGDNKIISVNCRVVSATNKDLAVLVAKGEFREDLYYRLNIFTVSVPPLRERGEDIPLLCAHFMNNMELGSSTAKLNKALKQQLQRLDQYRWPGNIRELSSACARIAVLRNLSDQAHIDRHFQNISNLLLSSTQDTVPLNIDAALHLKEAVDEAEQQYISAILRRNGNNQSATAKQLGIGRTTLWRRIAGEPRGGGDDLS